MARYTFQCSACKAEQEVVMPMATATFEDRPCPSCSQPSKYILLGAPAVATSSMSHQTIDVAVGRDAAARWDDINRRQEKRDKLRKQTGQVALTATGRNDFAPLTSEQKSKRGEAQKSVEREGFKPVPSFYE